ncbi:Modification methylase Eco47II [Durusdinium trenchii]|uniref:Modification methylase Eco47II n=1 Tax=Durusdinium trenchii TaxID=1381693 RepID=A0ABP0J8X6_9DINO
MECALFGEPPAAVEESWSGVVSLCSSLEGDEAFWVAVLHPWGHDALVADCGLLPTGCNKVTLYHWVVSSKEPLILTAAATSQAYPCSSLPRTFGSDLIEFAAGNGAMGLGPTFLGARIRVSIESCTYAVEHLKLNNHGLVIHDDISSLAAIKLAHAELNGSPTTGLFGFPCQPYSKQGLQLGEYDVRFDTLLGGLKATWFLQLQSLIIECVPSACTTSAVQEALDILCKAMGWEKVDLLLDLKHQWPMRRARWWGILAPPGWLSGPLHVWLPDSRFQTAGSLLKSWPAWAVDEEEDLLLTHQEYLIFQDQAFGTDQRWYGLQRQLPTILHSYGAWFGPCPCGCRSAAMAPETLKLKGIRGCYVTSSLTGQPRLLHPYELAYMLGIPCSMKFNTSPRDTLPLLGNVASSMQSVWIYALLVQSASRAIPEMFAIDPAQVLDKYKRELIRQFNQAHCIEVPLSSLCIVAEDGAELTLFAAGTNLAADLLHAEKLQLHPEASCRLFDGDRQMSQFERFPVQPHGRCYRLLIEGPYAKVSKDEMIVISLNDGQDHWVELLRAGQFLFEALSSKPFEHIYHFVDSAGRLYSRDTRLWQGPGLGLASGPVPGLGANLIWHAMQSLTRDLNAQKGAAPLLISPALAAQILGASISPTGSELEIGNALRISECFCIFAAEGHWALLWGCRHEGDLHWTYLDPLSDGLRSQAWTLASHLSGLLRGALVSFRHFSVYTQSDSFTCGTLALLHLAAALGLPGGLPPHAVQTLHLWLLRQSRAESFRAYGPADSTTIRQLTDVLIGHGVFPQAASERAQLVANKIGIAAVQQALNSRNPWAALKDKASQPGSAIRLVTHEELEAQITARAKTKHGCHIPRAKEKKSRTAATRFTAENLDVSLLPLDKSHFKDEDGDDIPQIQFEEVRSNGRGIAVCSQTDARAFIVDPKSISTDALALLVLPPLPPEACASANITSMRFPAVYGPQQEPMLVQSTMVSIGDVDIHRHFGASDTKLAVLDTSVFKTVIYRDELEQDWARFIQHPVRYLTELLPALQLCRGRKCGAECPRFHPPLDEDIDGAIQEVWARKFLSDSGRPVKPAEAAIYQLYLRVASLTATQVLESSVMGVYIEPRKADLSGTDPNYTVVWLPKADRNAAVRALKSFDGAQALVRVRDRYGVRVPVAHAAAASKELRPDIPYVDVRISRVFRLHPIPHGVQRNTLLKLFKDWGWTAKPMQPTKGSALGSAWEVGADKPPPKPIMPGFGADVLISEVRARSTANAELPSVISSCHPRKLTPAKSTSADPWLQASNDPWKQWSASSSSHVAPGATSTKHLQALETRLQASLKDTVQAQLEEHAQDASMASDTTLVAFQQEADQRFRVLEAGVSELKAQGQQFRSWFNDVHKGMEQMGTQIAGVQKTTEHLTTTLGASVTSSVNDAFDARFAQLEAMLAKRSRHE